MNTTPLVPFRIEVPQESIDDLQDRLARTRWPAPSPDGWSRGVPLDYLRGLAEYWRTEFDWRAQESALNELPHFTVTVEGGQRLHLIHARSPEPDALALVLSHGYPSSFVEFTRLIGPLTDPRAHGGDPADAFHVVVPSLVGFGWSTPVSGAGWDAPRTGNAMVAVMAALGYDRYGAHGGDAGAGVSRSLALHGPVVGVHAPTDPAALLRFVPLSDELPALSPAEQQRLEGLQAYLAEASGYLELSSTRPQTLGYALNDSPVGQLAWIVEKFQEWTDESAKLPEEAVDLDQLPTLVSTYWFTGSGASTAHFLYDAAHAGASWGQRGTAPSGLSGFGITDDVRGIVNLLRERIDPTGSLWWSAHEQGGHFPAMEAPDLLAPDIRAFFRDKR